MASVREWDEQSYRSDRGSRPVTVRRYKISDVEESDDRWETTSRVSRRETEAPRARSRSRTTTREFRFEKEASRSPSPEVRQIRIEREVSRDPPRRRDHDDYELDHYTRSTEYYERERPERERHREAQTIIIKNEAPSPIIIRERENVEGRELARRESSHEEEKKEENLEVQSTRSQRSVSVDNRQIARRDASPEEDYYYQRTTREIARRPRHDEYNDYRHARERPRDDNYSDDEVYYRRTEYTDPDEHSIRDPNHRRHLAEGAIVGLGAAALANHNKKKKGEKSGGAGQLIGGAVVGAGATELYSRANRYWKDHESRDREYSDRGRRYGSPGRSRERSHSRGHDLAKYGAMAAIGALAGYAASRAGKDKKDDRRSRSRRRRHSRGRRSRSRSSSNGKSPSASKRNSTIAGAGLASAAVAGLVEHHRSKSRGGRSKSRIRTGLPIAAAGLGGAALAGLYEKKKGKKTREHSRARSVSRSPSHSRSRSVAPDERSRELANDDHLIQYGEGTIPPEDGRPRSRADSDYSNYGRHRGSPSSAESSPRRHRHSGSNEHHHYGTDAAAVGGAGAGIAGVAAHEASQRRERKRAERRRREQQEDRGETPLQQQQQHGQEQQAYGFGPYAQEPPPSAPPVQQQQQGPNYYSQPNNFGAPQNPYIPVPNFTGQQAYAPQEYAQPQPQYAQPQPQQQQQGPQPGGFDPNSAHYQPGAHVSSDFPESRSVSRPNPSADTADKVGSATRPHLTRSLSSGDISPLDTTRQAATPLTGRRASRVHFDLHPHTWSLSDRSLTHNTLDRSSSNLDLVEGGGGGQGLSGGRAAQNGDAHGKSKAQQHRRERAQHRSSSPVSDNSSDTIILPDRFDGQGRKKPERGDDPLADMVEDTFHGRNGAGRVIRRFLGGSAGTSRGTNMRRSKSQ